MNDSAIIGMLFERSDEAIKELSGKYKNYCSTIARNILHNEEDTEECLNDTWLKVWSLIPPERPNKLSVFIGRITRNLAIDRYRNRKAEKNGSGETKACLDELYECVGDGESFSDNLILKDVINRFLGTLKEENRKVFMLRYWYMFPIKSIGERFGMSEGAVKMSLQRTRHNLKEYLEKEGIEI